MRYKRQILKEHKLRVNRSKKSEKGAAAGVCRYPPGSAAQPLPCAARRGPVHCPGGGIIGPQKGPKGLKMALGGLKGPGGGARRGLAGKMAHIAPWPP